MNSITMYCVPSSEPGVEHAHDVGVVQSRRGLGLAAEALDEAGVARELGQQDLDGDRAVEDGVDAAVDLRHPAGPDPGFDA